MEISGSVILIGLFNLVLVSAQYGQSPCPDIFDYRSDGSGTYGMIRLQPSGRATSIVVRANFTIATRLFTNYVGRIQPLGGNLNSLQDYNNGIPIEYRVDFPLTSPLPKLTAISVNDNVICYGPGDVPGPGSYVTTTSLQHTLYLKGQSSPGFFNQYERPEQTDHSNSNHGFQVEMRPDNKPDTNSLLMEYFGTIPNDAQIFTFGDDDRTGSWNSINTRPEYDRPRPQPSRPPQPTQPPQYYPEYVTQPPPTQPTPPPSPPPPPPQNNPPLQPSRQPSPPEQGSAPVQCGVVAGGNERQPLIFNGLGYSRGDWPWLTAIYKRKDGSLTFICSGTLVSDRHVVTAAHCMRQKNTFSSNKDIVVKVGVYNLEDWGDDITVTRTLASATIHESYNATSLANDILVLTFERSVEFNTNIRPACLWNGNPDLSRIVGASGVVAGWGRSEIGPAGRGEPRVVRMPIVSTATCRASRPDFHKLTSSNTLCAGDRNGAGPCLGDSGGGLYILEGGRWQLRGVVSLSLRPDSGDSTCNLNEYIVFTDSAKYTSWINTILRTS